MCKSQFYEHFYVSFLQDGDEDYNNDEDGRLSKSGKELKKLLGCLNESDTEDDDANGDEDVSYLLRGV